MPGEPVHLIARRGRFTQIAYREMQNDDERGDALASDLVARPS